MIVLAAVVLLPGCASVKRGAIPVVESGAPVSEEISSRQTNRVVNPPPISAQPVTNESGVMVMVPQQSSEPLQTFGAPDDTFPNSPPQPAGALEQWQRSSQPAPVPAPTQRQPLPTGIPSASGTLSADERLDGPVLALLTTAQQQQGGGDLNGAASSLERAQRIAPREPQVLYRLAQVRLAQGDAVQAEQLSRRGLSYASDRPALQASLWELIAQARERQGNAAGAAQARERAKVTM